jgi:hypothetical protein
MSQSKLARESGVSRFKICTHELGDGCLTAEEERRIHRALRLEAARLERISIQFQVTEQPTSEDKTSRV